MLTINVPINSENVNRLILTSDNAPIITYDEITRVQVVTDTMTLDSQTDPALFDLTQPDCIIFKFGDSTLPLGLLPARLRVYTLLYEPDGLFWAFFQMNVFDGGIA